MSYSLANFTQSLVSLRERVLNGTYLDVVVDDDQIVVVGGYSGTQGAEVAVLLAVFAAGACILVVVCSCIRRIW